MENQQQQSLLSKVIESVFKIRNTQECMSAYDIGVTPFLGFLVSNEQLQEIAEQSDIDLEEGQNFVSLLIGSIQVVFSTNQFWGAGVLEGNGRA